jgi:GNAT superfamily N-acetyltransferase
MSDEMALLEFFRSHSRETVYQRYHYPVAELSRDRLQKLLGVDQVRDVAFAIVENTGDGDRIHAIGRYYTEPGDQIAEMAFVVRESMRRLGFALRLLYKLGETAAGRLSWLRAQVLRDNVAMRGLLRPFAAEMHTLPNSDVVEYFVPVSALVASAPESLCRYAEVSPR